MSIPIFLRKFISLITIIIKVLDYIRFDFHVCYSFVVSVLSGFLPETAENFKNDYLGKKTLISKNFLWNHFWGWTNSLGEGFFLQPNHNICTWRQVPMQFWKLWMTHFLDQFSGGGICYFLSKFCSTWESTLLLTG